LKSISIMGAMPKSRIDILLVDRGQVPDLTKAQRLLMAGQVRVNGQLILNPATQVDSASELVVESGPRFVSRGGEKLEAGLLTFRLAVNGCICADVGASTGGFTDCLLHYGAVRVYAIDVGHGILDWKLRQDPRVIVMEDTNARYVKHLNEPVNLVTIDVSFISLTVLLPVVKGWFSTSGEVVALVKPQFEARKTQSAHGRGVIRDPEIHRKVLIDVLDFSQQAGYEVQAVIRSPLFGPKGNTEFLAYLKVPALATQDTCNLVAGLFPPSGGSA
jgi:23S rRNA (cytidine1920-2'-O)/16S rRNA (cytidine1409-2'-O)-methyltransferase